MTTTRSKNFHSRARLLGGLALGAAIALIAAQQARADQKAVTGTVKVDGSSTVYPITEAVAEEFGAKFPGVRVTVGISGTGGGFKKFCPGETDISDASRPIKATEVKACKEGHVDYIELPVAYDGLSVLVNKTNDFAKSMTVEELQKLWVQGGVTKWSEVRAGWPDRVVKLYGPGTDSGTFDYFVEAIVTPSHKIRADFTASEDDNVLVQGISGDKDALGFFGYSYYVENKDKMNAVAIDGGKGPITPAEQTIKDGTYQPLSRPIFIYVNAKAAERPEVQEFVRFYLKNATKLVKEAGYIPLPESLYEIALKHFEARKLGSAFGGSGAAVGVKLEDLMKKETAQ